MSNKITLTKDEFFAVYEDCIEENTVETTRWGTLIEYIIPIKDKHYRFTLERIPEEGIMPYEDSAEGYEVEPVVVQKTEWVSVSSSAD
jgi:hypothetical protein